MIIFLPLLFLLFVVEQFLEHYNMSEKADETQHYAYLHDGCAVDVGAVKCRRVCHGQMMAAIHPPLYQVSPS